MLCYRHHIVKLVVVTDFPGTTPLWGKLFGGTAPPKNTIYVGIVPPNNTLFGGTVPPKSILFGRTPDLCMGTKNKDLYQILFLL